MNNFLFHKIFIKYGVWIPNPCNGGGWKIGFLFYNAYDRIEIIHK